MISLVLAAAISWPVRYNDGVTAYHSNDFSSAAATFEQATASPDRALQQRALYNLGNTAYRLGEADPTKAQPLWERAIKSYETALALDPKDEDAKFNHEFVKKKLEELKQQQQEQQQQEQQKKEQEKKQQSTGGEARQSQPDQQSNQPSQQEQQKHQQPRRGSESKEQKAQEPKSQPSEQKPPPQEQEPQASQAGNVDKQQAKALLDNLREDERNWNFFPEVQMKDLKDAGEPAKDW